MNPLLGTFDTPFQTIPFQSFAPEHFPPAFELAFEEAREDIRRIIEDDAEPDFKNTIEKLEEAGKRLGDLSAILFNLNHAETNEAIQGLAREMAPRLTAFSNDITLNPLLFEKIRKVKEQSENLLLNAEEKMLLDKSYKNFIRNGAHLAEQKKEEFRDISGRLSKLGLQFGENVLAETNAYYLQIKEEKDLEGLPEGSIQQARADAGVRNQDGWIFTLQFPSYMPFMKYAKNRDLRREMYLAFGRRCSQNNEHNNREIVREIVSLRYRLAKLLGFKNYASFVLENRMAETEEKVYSFLEVLKEAYLPPARREVEELSGFARRQEAELELMPWDWAFYSEKLKEEKFGIDDELTRPYFELEPTINIVFELAKKLYGIDFIRRKDISVYHPEVESFEVRDEKGKYLAVLYMDYFPRAGKKPGAWMTEYLQQHRVGGQNIRPHVSLVFNFPRPGKDKPVLLSYQELRTLLHEFGHGLHAIFSQVKYKTLSGTSVYRDFVELPSQLMENWAEQKEWLQLAAKHYKSGETMDELLIGKLLASKNFHEAYMGCRQLGFAFLDMAWHSITEDPDEDIIRFEEQATARVALLPRVREVAASPAFNHIFGGGYAAGYYGYKWAEVLDADAFSQFVEKGIFNRMIADSFRKKILSRGGTRHPMELYIDFMGREPKIDALLQRSGS